MVSIGTYFSIATTNNEWFRLVTYKRIKCCGVYSLETLHSEWHRNNNSAFKNKLSCLQCIATTVATLDFYMSNPDAHVLDDFEDIFPKLKHSLFGINKFIKQIQK